VLLLKIIPQSGLLSINHPAGVTRSAGWLYSLLTLQSDPVIIGLLVEKNQL
jgi:hypothetical protein